MSSYRTTTCSQRVAIIEMQQAGASYELIAKQFALNYYTVRKWCRRFRDGNWTAVFPLRQRKKGILSQFHPLVRYSALRLKRKHPGWGADKILLEMSRTVSLKSLRLPKRSSLNRYYQSFAPRLSKHRPSRNQRPQANIAQLSGVHQLWQMDFKGEVRLGDVGKVKPFMVCDAYSSAPLACLIHSGKRGAIRMSDVQADLRKVFSDWGLPNAIRMDRDPLWVGSTRLEFPSRLLLWLIGLDVLPIINRAGRPTDNAQIERCNGIWFEQVGREQSYTEIQQVQSSSDLARHDRLFYLPSANPHCHGQAPALALPELLVPLRPYQPDNEAQLFQMSRVYQHLSLWTWHRLVDSSGQISLSGHSERLGYSLAGQVVKLLFDPQSQLFLAYSLTGTLLKSFSHPMIKPETICAWGSSTLDSS